jgi:hypothetical protein
MFVDVRDRPRGRPAIARMSSARARHVLGMRTTHKGAGMRIATRSRSSLARLGAALAAVTALATAFLGTPALATTKPQVAPAAVIADGLIRWHNIRSGECLTFAAGARGAAFQQACDDANFSGANSEWYARNVGGNNYTFINQAIPQCLSISGSSVSDGAAVFIWTCTAGLTAQIFTLVPVGTDTYELVNINSNKCVSVGGAKLTAGAWVIQWTCYGGGEQLWRPY